MEKEAKIFVAGPEGMIGSALLRYLENSGFSKLITKTSSKLDLTEQKQVLDFFMAEKPDYVFMAAGKTGGIVANRAYPAEFIYYNIQVETNVIHSAWKSGVRKLLLLGSSCTYPKECPQPMKEEYLLTGKLEPTSEPYAIAKIAGMKMCQSYNLQYGTNYISVIPADVYGPNDDFDPETAHVLPALLGKVHQAKVSNEKEVVVWGSGAPRRELFYVDDLADACVFLMNHYNGSAVINVGFGKDISIKELAFLVKEVVGFDRDIVFDRSKPDGMPQKLLDSTRIRNMGWRPKISLQNGIEETYRWYRQHLAAGQVGDNSGGGG